MRLLDLVRGQKVTVKVDGDVLVVTMPGTDFRITYEKTDENRLVASNFHARHPLDERRKVKLSKVFRLSLDGRKRQS